jgi:HAE1 family hydrophobic/amphiphilic exporter-1
MHKKIGVEGVKSVSSLAGYEILTEGNRSNAGTFD